MTTILYLARGTRTLDSGEVVPSDFVTISRTSLTRVVDGGDVLYRSAESAVTEVCVSELERAFPGLAIAPDTCVRVAMTAVVVP